MTVGMIQEDQVLLQSSVGERIWALYEDRAAFQQAVKDYFALGMPRWRVVRAVYQKRQIWLAKIEKNVG
ncbi:hypothetical protein [Gorillibacterium sp. sgz5001074]|uniref:hypothetical protein n=1 Tax=Gorillibacterium sp. sgz5001074 TaxID=3446695 RepID=UPI003F6820FC